MAITFKSLLDQVSDDMDEATWLSLFETYRVMSWKSDNVERIDFLNAMMALPVANLAKLYALGGIVDWSALHKNPMLPLWVEVADPSLMAIAKFEIRQKVREIGDNPNLYSMRKRPGSGATSPKEKRIKKSTEQKHKCFVQTVRRNDSWSNFSVDSYLMERYSLGHAYTQASHGLFDDPEDFRLSTVIDLTKILFILAPCFGLPRPKTILSFMMENDP